LSCPPITRKFWSPRALLPLRAEIARAGCRAEIIVVDNNSTDGTRRIASLVPGVVVVDEPQRGLVQARRAGCLAAKGDLIANIDADTMLTEGWLCTALAEFSRSPDLVALSGPCIYYDLPRSAQFIAAVFYRIAFATYLFVRFVLGAGVDDPGGATSSSPSARWRRRVVSTPISISTANIPIWPVG
jgi:glycosyltransferase involved in cell wall biosynthesis